MTKEQVFEFKYAQHKLVISDILLSKMESTYDGVSISELFPNVDLKEFRSKLESAKSESISISDRLIKEIGVEALMSTLQDKEVIESIDFNDDIQRKATYEVINEELTLEEFLGKYCAYE